MQMSIVEPYNLNTHRVQKHIIEVYSVNGNLTRQLIQKNC